MESTKEIMSLRTSSDTVAMRYSGDICPSVMATTSAPRSRAYSTAWMAIWEYRGKLMPTSTSPGPIWLSCSKISPAAAFCTRVTFLNIRCR